MSNKARLLCAGCAIIIGLIIVAPLAGAAGRAAPTNGSGEMLIDVGIQYVRTTQAAYTTDTAARFSVGGMFNEWLGIDGAGMFMGRSKDYLIGGDVRLAPTDWFFLKGGAGAYAEKANNTLNPTPILGAGILAHITRDVYFVTESSYFTFNSMNNISFGAGLGFNF